MSKKNGLEHFHQFYQEIYGGEWPLIWDSFLNHKSYLYLHPKIETHPSTEILKQPFVSVELKEKDSLPKDVYAIDEASFYSISLISSLAPKKILDSCAAPGGKTLSYLCQYKDFEEYVCADRSRERMARLKRNIDQFVSDSLLEKIKVTSKDATKWGREYPEYFDLVILDAPCSSERHWANKKHLLKEWSSGRTKRLQKDQFSILASCYDSLAEGGHLLYMTCSVSPGENERQIEYLSQKRSGVKEVRSESFSNGRLLKYGRIILPHEEDGVGPLYLCLIQKDSSLSKD